MNKLLFLLSLLLVLSVQVFAEPILLPDLEITGNSSIRSFLYKKHVLPDSTYVVTDSLSNFIPNVEWNQVQDPKAPEVIRNGVVSASVNTANQVFFDASLYNFGDMTDLIKYNMRFEYPEPDQMFFDNHLYIELPKQSKLTDRFSSTFHTSKFNAHRLQNYALDFYLKVPDVQLNSFTYSNVQTTLGASYFSQNDEIDSRNSLSPNILHRSKLHDDKFEIDNNIMFSDMILGIQSDIYARELFQYPVLDITHWGIMFDNRRILPTVRFHYEYVPDYNESLQISNNPVLMINDKEEIAKHYRWYALISNPRYVKKPLNLDVVYSVLTAHPILGLWDRFNISANSSLAYDVALPLTAYNNSVPLIGYNDIFANSLGLNAGYIQVKGMKISQEIRTNLSYLPSQNMVRTPYTPLFLFDTELTGTYQNIAYKANLTQQYNILDHNQKHINEVVDLSVAGQYQLANNTTLQASLRNLLNTKRYVFKGLPSEGIRLEVGINYIF